VSPPRWWLRADQIAAGAALAFLAGLPAVIRGWQPFDADVVSSFEFCRRPSNIIIVELPPDIKRQTLIRAIR
jgi:hypothetical protein